MIIWSFLGSRSPFYKICGIFQGTVAAHRNGRHQDAEDIRDQRYKSLAGLFKCYVSPVRWAFQSMMVRSPVKTSVWYTKECIAEYSMVLHGIELRWYYSCDHEWLAWHRCWSEWKSEVAEARYTHIYWLMTVVNNSTQRIKHLNFTLQWHFCNGIEASTVFLSFLYFTNPFSTVFATICFHAKH